MDIDNTHFAGADRGDGFVEGGREPARIVDRADADPALSAGHRGEVDVGIADRLADPAVFGRPAALARDPLLVQLVIEERAVVGEHDQQRDAVAHRRPQRGDAHQEIAVAEHRDRQALAVAQRQSRADRHARPRSDAAAAIGAEKVERVPEIPQMLAPAERQPDHRCRRVGQRRLQRRRQ